MTEPNENKVVVTIGQHKLDLKRKSAKSTFIPDMEDISIEHQIAPPPCPFHHLVLVVHGIGRHDTGYFEMIEKMNKKINKMFRAGGVGGTAKRIKFLPIEWHSVIREDLGTLIQDVTPPANHKKSLPKSIREAIDESFMDYVLFNDPGFARKIYTEVTDQLNYQYMEFIKTYPAFDGKVSIYAHSLGSVISYDILTNQPSPSLLQSNEQKQFILNNDSNIECWRKVRRIQLAKDKANHLDVNPIKPEFKHPYSDHFSPLVFQTYNFITIGSPVGVICSLRRYNYLPIPSCINWYNIYNICDPVAYLIEPIIDKSFKAYETNFLKKIKDSKKKKGSSNNNNNDESSDEDLDYLFINKDEDNNNNTQQQQQKPDSSKEEKLFSNYRFDHAIRPTGIHISEYSPLLTSHSDYWLSSSVLYFVGSGLK